MHNGRHYRKDRYSASTMHKGRCHIPRRYLIFPSTQTFATPPDNHTASNLYCHKNSITKPSATLCGPSRCPALFHARCGLRRILFHACCGLRHILSCIVPCTLWLEAHTVCCLPCCVDHSKQLLPCTYNVITPCAARHLESSTRPSATHLSQLLRLCAFCAFRLVALGWYHYTHTHNPLPQRCTRTEPHTTTTLQTLT